MSLQKFRADKQGATCANGARPFFSEWMGGPSLALVKNCPVDIAGGAPRTVYLTGHADTFFSIPAVISWKGKRLRGFLICEDSNYQFVAYTAELEKFGLSRAADSSLSQSN
jgi:hypothetical protein